MLPTAIDPSSTSTAIHDFQPPPSLRNCHGQIRKAGFEFEYAGLGIQASAKLVQRTFGGEHAVVSPGVHKVTGTPHGDFTIEIDSAVVKDRRYEGALRAVGLNPQNWNTDPLEKLLVGVLSTWVPYEVATPPIPIDRLAMLDDLRQAFFDEGARGTRASIRYAFGMHINPELPDESPASVRDHLRAFLLLYPWLSERVNVNITRRIMPFINPFPIKYSRLVLQSDYPADAGRLIDDYLEYNPTRNRPLDLLPVLSHLDETRVMRRAEDPHLVKPRPAYHYRLPNCLIDEPHWTIAREWNTWVAVERLAVDHDRLAAMSRDYLDADEQSFRPFVDKWPNVLKEYGVDA
jgi:hypothetical protein